jgi:hypothetical protein
MSCGITTATPGIKQHSPLDRLTPGHAKKQNKQKKLNNKKITIEEHAAGGSCKHIGEGERSKELISV